MRHVSEKTGKDLEQLNDSIAWPLYKKYGHAHEAFKIAITFVSSSLRYAFVLQISPMRPRTQRPSFSLWRPNDRARRPGRPPKQHRPPPDAATRQSPRRHRADLLCVRGRARDPKSAASGRVGQDGRHTDQDPVGRPAAVRHDLERDRQDGRDRAARAVDRQDQGGHRGERRPVHRQSQGAHLSLSRSPFFAIAQLFVML